jgi:predicted aspartyl protease
MSRWQPLIWLAVVILAVGSTYRDEFFTAMEPPPAAHGRHEAVRIAYSNGSAMIRVRLGSRETVWAVIDSGCATALLVRSVANRLVASGAAYRNGREEIILADGSVRTLDQIVIRELKVGSHIAREVQSSVAEDGTENLLGLNPLNQMGRFSLDIARGQLVFD